jgi:phenylpyruvate tautomerase PptA (4-oxalocrotonate tautomerase family)
MRRVTWGVIEEVPSGDWAIGGHTMFTETAREMAANVRGAPE